MGKLKYLIDNLQGILTGILSVLLGPFLLPVICNCFGWVFLGMCHLVESIFVKTDEWDFDWFIKISFDLWQHGDKQEWLYWFVDKQNEFCLWFNAIESGYEQQCWLSSPILPISSFLFLLSIYDENL
jgi:hypothetical protein